jgi:hypothetical protein
MPWVALLLTAALAQQVPVPQPFPRPPATSQPDNPAQPPPVAAPRPMPPAQPRPTPPTPASDATLPSEAVLGVPVYPGAQFLTSYDAGLGQRYYIFGSTASFAELVKYYRTVLRQRGDVVFESPATHQFDVGRFREEEMVFPPGVTIKDYVSTATPSGFPNPKPGAQPSAFPTVIQIVTPPPAADASR